MNIIFNSLEIDDFQSIGHALVELDNQGVCLVKGVNNYEENTASNGSGKSSIFEAMYFSLYGKTTTGLTNVSNRYTGNTYKLRLKFSIDNVNYEIIREGTKITVLENDIDISRRNKTDTENYIKENILKISSDIFLNIIYLSQGFKSRLSALTAGGRKEQIEELIGTNEITENFRIEVQNYKEKLNTKLDEVNNKISYNSGTYTQIETNINKYQNEINRILEERKNQPNKEELNKQIEELNTKLKIEKDNKEADNQKLNQIKEANHQVELSISELNLNISNTQNSIQVDLNKILDDYNNKTFDLQKTNNKLNDYDTKILENKNEISLLNANNITTDNQMKINLKQIETLKTSDICPTCGRKFDNFDQSHLIQEIQKLLDANIESKKLIDENIQKIQEIEKLNKTLEEQKEVERQKMADEQHKLVVEKESQEKIIYNKRDKEIKLIENQIEERKKLILDTSNYDNLLLNHNTIISNIESQINNIQNIINNIKEESTENYENMIKESKDELIKIVKDNELLQKESSNLTEQIAVATHCTSLISKEFKNYLLKSAIEFLNSKLEYYSNMLFSNEQDKIKFIQDGNKLDIYLGDAIFESLSGGEKRKVDIAIMLAQKDLANNMSNTYSNILVADEIFDGLDSKSIDIVTSILMNVSKDISSMFVVSHKDTSMGADKQLLVIKGKDRVSYVQ